MSTPPTPPDPWVAFLTRRLLLLGLVVLCLSYLGTLPWTRGTLPEAGAATGPEPTPDEAAAIRPAAPWALDPPGPGTLLPPFDVSDVEHSRFGWALLDRSAGQVLVLDPTGAPVRRVARRGAGPGELERPLHVALAAHGDVAVLDATGQRLDLFPGSGLPVRIAVPARECRGSFGDDVVGHDGAWWIVRRCFDGPEADLEVLRVGPDGAPAAVLRRPLTRMNTDPHLVPLLVPHDGALFAGSNREACLSAVGGPGRLCLPRPRPLEIPDSTAERLFGDLGRRAAAVGIDLRIPTHYPGFIEVRSHPGTPVVRTIRADGSDAWAILRGDTLRVAEVGAGARAEPGAAGWLLLRDDGAGLRVWVLPHGSGTVSGDDAEGFGGRVPPGEPGSGGARTPSIRTVRR